MRSLLADRQHLPSMQPVLKPVHRSHAKVTGPNESAAKGMRARSALGLDALASVMP
jgi:hypothetical protein